MKKHKMECPYVISKFEKHIEIKSKLLDLIASDPALPIDLDGLDKVSRGDWFVDPREPRSYLNFLVPHLHPHMIDVYELLGHDHHEYSTFWFQQYVKSDKHRWHQHRRTCWTNVYYVELPEGAPKTNLRDPFTNEIIVPDIQEGDILTFPGLVWHCSPESECDERKTIVAFNVN